MHPPASTAYNLCMRSGTLATFATIAAIAGAGLWSRHRGEAQITRPQPAPAAGELQSVTLIFGSKDAEPTQWDGSVALSAGTIEKVAGWHFTTQSSVTGTTWKCATHPWAKFAAGMHPNEKPQPQPTPFQPIGVTIDFRAPADANLQIHTAKGDFSFRPMDVPETGGIFPLGAQVEVYRTPVVEAASTPDYEDDYPAIAASGNSLWVAWQGYRDSGDHVFLRERAGGQWSPIQTLTPKPGDVFQPSVVAVNGRPVVTWSERDGGNWHIREWREGTLRTLTSGEGSNLFQRAAADRKGNLSIAYQRWQKGHSNIYLRQGDREVTLSDPARHLRANDWYPAVAVDRSGTAWVAWDGYAAGNYNVYLRSVSGGRAGELLAVTTSTRFHAHPSIAIDGQDRVWVAWDEGPENWGNDVGFLLSGGTGLYEAREIKVAVYTNGRWMTPLRQPGDIVPYGFRRYFQTPHLAADSQGRIWLLARPRTSANLPTSLWAAGGKWEAAATCYTGDRWSELIPIPESVGRNEGGLDTSAGPDGSVLVAWVTDHRLWGGPAFGELPRNNDIEVAQLRLSGGGAPQLGPRPPEPPGGLPSEPREREQFTALRAYEIKTAGHTYKIYRGDMHRHTDISMDGAGDGSLFDAYRYAMDGANLDFFLVTDHQSGLQEYTWWRIEKSADMFHVPGFFTALYGTERSLPYPNGHRNLVFTRRGVRILPITPEEQKSSTGPVLYPYLRANQGIAMSHTSATNMGTDWRDNDPLLEPLVEIFQGARTSAEHEGAPLSPTGKRTELWAGGYRPAGFVWNAWAKGYRLGVQASSDHVSTHLSYSCVLAEQYTREGIVDAIRKRHSYAATSNIVLDYRINAGTQTWLHGDEASAAELPEITAHIVGTGPLKHVMVVRDNTYIYSQNPQGSTYDLRYRENALAAGTHYYYVRVEQQDGNMAWSSPIWVRYNR